MVRAKRRFDELVEKGQTTTIEEVLANLEKRDHIDSNRADSPLMQAADAVTLDNKKGQIIVSSISLKNYQLFQEVKGIDARWARVKLNNEELKNH